MPNRSTPPSSYAPDRILLVPAQKLSVLRYFVIQHPLPTDVAIPEPNILQLFPDYRIRLGAGDLSDVLEQVQRAVYGELLIMKVSYLDSGFYWTYRWLFVGD